MTATGNLRSLVPLIVLLSLTGCKQEATGPAGAKKPPADAPGPAAKPADAKQQATGAPAANDSPPPNIRRGIGKMLPSVQRGLAGLDLQNIAKLYAADAVEGRPPKKIEDLKGLDARTIQAVKDGEYVVLWNANRNAPGSAIVAYEKDVPTKGGMVATLTGTVTRMKPDEFKEAPKVSGQ